jgi:hypothetical protein
MSDHNKVSLCFLHFSTNSIHFQSSSSDDSFVKLAIPYDEFDILVTDINEQELELVI